MNRLLLLFFLPLLINNYLFAQKNYFIGTELKFTAPEGWTSVDDPTGRVDVVIKKSQYGFSENITSRVVGEVPDKNLFRNRDKFINTIRSRYPNLRVENLEKVQLFENENDLIFEIIIPSPPNDAWSTQFYFIYNEVCYFTSITGRVLQASELRAIFQEYIDSFEPVSE